MLGFVASARSVKRYKKSPLSYGIFEICFGDELLREEWERAGVFRDKEAQLEILKESNPAKSKTPDAACVW